MSLRFACLCALALTVGCTSADFGSTDPGNDDASVDDAGGDATIDSARPGDDSAAPDGPLPDGSSFDGDTALPTDATASCVGKPDGTPCDSSDGLRRICVAEGCTLSKCGDRIIDLTAGEECDDANDVKADGCEPLTCKFSCHGTSECPSTTCITGRACDAHKCTDGTIQPKTTPCTLPTGGSGACNGGVCASTTCGNGLPEAGEECDDGDTDPNNGCKNDCTYTCRSASDCGDGNACNGIESCNTTTHRCGPGTPLTCDDSNPCTANTCVAGGGCTNPFIDGDGDGYAPAAAGTCTGAYTGKDGDCADGNLSVHPGAPETCNGLDDNCNSTADEGLAHATCGVGECVNTGSSCLPTSCTPKPAGTEICDGKDNDCNGINDNGVPLATCGIGECLRTGTTCFAASCTAGTPTAEICDGKDNDCDTKTDNVPGTCFTGPGTVGKGICKAGTNACGATSPYTAFCAGQVIADSAFHDTIGIPGGASQSGWDYNCDGTDELALNRLAKCTKGASGFCATPIGWTGSIPGCGESGTKVTGCVVGPTGLCNLDVDTFVVEVQKCR